MKTMTLNLSDEEMAALEQLATEKDMSKTACLRQSLRLYQLIHIKSLAGETFYFGDENSPIKAQVYLL